MNRRKYSSFIFVMFFIVTAAYAKTSSIGLHGSMERLRKMKRHLGYSRFEMEKCLTPYINIIAENWNKMPSIYRKEFQDIFTRPNIPGGYGYLQGLPLKFRTTNFHFHYTINGPDAVPREDIAPKNGVPDYIDVCADAYERAYRIEVELMGFKKPLDDFWMSDNGGDERLDVYLFAGPWLGFTAPEWFGRMLPSAATGVPYFGINSRIYDYFGKTEGKRYIETTSAHEFLHSIQFAYNYYMPRWFMECTSTWIESVVYDGGRIDDGDDIADPDEMDETDAFNYYFDQLRYWFLHPDWPLELFNGWHEYADVIFVMYITQRFGWDIVQDVYETASEGSYREMGTFWEAFENRGVALIEAFKTFTVWNYFTYDRDDGGHYFKGNRIPPVAIHLDDIYETYPAQRLLDSGQMPEHFGSRYVVFEPSAGVNQTLAVKINGGDITDDEDLSRLQNFGLRGWSAKLILEMDDGSHQIDDILTFHRSQEGQNTYKDFGTKIRKIILILINLHPDIERIGDHISYAAGEPPSGKLSTPILAQSKDGTVIIRWDVEDISGIKEVVIVRKRYAPSENDFDNTNLLPSAVFQASDLDSNSIPDSNVDIIARVRATDTIFEDDTIFADIDMTQGSFDPTSVRYYYAVVPVNEFGIMGEPSIAKDGITPVSTAIIAAPTFFIRTEERVLGEWAVEVISSQKLQAPPKLICTLPTGNKVNVDVSRKDGRFWEGLLILNSFPQRGTYVFTISGRNSQNIIGKTILSGRTFTYNRIQRKMHVTPNPFRMSRDKYMKFSPRGMKVRIYNMRWELIKELNENSEWNRTNSSGEKVRSGIYFYVAEDENGFRQTGKIVVRW